LILDEELNIWRGLFFSVGLLIASYLSITNDDVKIENPFLILLALGILLFSFVMTSTYFTYISSSFVNKFKIVLIIEIRDFFEDNKHWLGYGFVILLTIIGIFTLIELGFTRNQIIGGIVFELIFFIIIKSRKIINRIKSIKFAKL